MQLLTTHQLPRAISFILFLALCASLAYWAIEFFTPPPRSVAAPSNTTQALPPVSVAADLFGGKADANTMANVQLRGVILAGRAAESVVILVPDGGSAKYLRRDAEVIPGVTVQKIEAKKVVLSDHGVSREVNLAVFAPTVTAGIAQANANAVPQPAPVVPSATGSINETGLSPVQSSNSAGSSAAPAPTASGNGNNNRQSAPANNAAATPSQIAPQNSMPRVQQTPPRQPPQPQDVTGTRAE